jgi:hypothetical protein
MVHYGDHTRWSECERGRQKLDVARFELFLIKIGRHPQYKPVKRA